ncbi:hypothetical protein EV426DRAFT_684443, partial [Tirmania nivea]
MHLAMIIVSCLLSFICAQATPILSPVSSTSSPTVPTPIAATRTVATSSIETITAEISVERSTISSMLASNVEVSAVLTQDPSPVPDPSDLIITPQAVSCDRDRETKTWEVFEAIGALVALGKKKRCYQIAGPRPGAFSCSRMMIY